jgi:vitamin B12 transporter
MGPHIRVAASCGVRRACLLSSSVLSIPFWLDALPAFAQPVALPTVQVDVTSPTTVPTPPDQVASSVTVITAAEIAREQRRTLPDALSTVPGLNIVQTGGPGGQTSVFLRGTNSNHVKVLLDGIDVTDPSNPNQTFDFAHMLTGDIERIEVLRGPQSGLYGADAIGGVISITTKKGEGPPKAYGTMEGGSFGTFNQYAGVSGSQDRFSYAFNVQHWRSTSTPVTPTALLSPGEKRNNDLYDNKTVSTRMGYDFNDAFSVNVVSRYTRALLRFTGDFDDNFGPDFAQSEQLSHQSYTRGEAVWSLFDGRFKNYFGLAYTNVQNQNTFPQDPNVNGLVPGSGPSRNEGTRTKLDWRGVAAITDTQTLVMGLEDETYGLIQSSPFGGLPVASNANKAAYVELQSQFAKRLFLVSNIRRDDNDAFGGHQTFRIAPAFLMPGTETKLKASYGTGFKAPTLSQLHADFPPTFFSNPNLQPEESKGWDAGFEQPFAADRVRVGATYFHNDITNLIQTVAIPGMFAFGIPVDTLVNIGQATTSGVEAFASFSVTERLKLRTDYTYTKAIDDGTGLELLRRPRTKISATAAWNPIDPLTLSATVLHVSGWADIPRDDFSVSRVQADGYTVVNLAANYAVDQNVTVFGRVDNLFNEHYQNPSGFERPGIGVFGGVRVSNR